MVEQSRFLETLDSWFVHVPYHLFLIFYYFKISMLTLQCCNDIRNLTYYPCIDFSINLFKIALGNAFFLFRKLDTLYIKGVLATFWKSDLKGFLLKGFHVACHAAIRVNLFQISRLRVKFIFEGWFQQNSQYIVSVISKKSLVYIQSICLNRAPS